MDGLSRSKQKNTTNEALPSLSVTDEVGDGENSPPHHCLVALHLNPGAPQILRFFMQSRMNCPQEIPARLAVDARAKARRRSTWIRSVEHLYYTLPS